MLIFTPLSNIKRVSARRFKWGTTVKGVVLDNKNTHRIWDGIYHTIYISYIAANFVTK